MIEVTRDYLGWLPQEAWNWINNRSLKWQHREKRQCAFEAVIREQAQTFAVVIVKPYVVQNRSEAASAINGSMPRPQPWQAIDSA
ncbi:MAG TPA: hypothetical protein VHC00_19355 [Rhizobiaceae bacterium]|nr:hypothetical protein [Rhizobiaceae bacterium]